MYPGETQFSHVAFVFVSQKRLQVSLVFAPHFHPCRRRLWHCWRCPALACYRISSWRPAETKVEITFERKGLATRLHRLPSHFKPCRASVWHCRLPTLRAVGRQPKFLLVATDTGNVNTYWTELACCSIPTATPTFSTMPDSCTNTADIARRRQIIGNQDVCR